MVSTATLKVRRNGRGQAYNGRLHHATVDSTMWAKTSSTRCIQDQLCQPLGGHSVWAALPPFPQGTKGAPTELPITLVLASIDSNGLFHSKLKVPFVQAAGMWALHVASCKGRHCVRASWDIISECSVWKGVLSLNSWKLHFDRCFVLSITWNFSEIGIVKSLKVCF